MKILKERVIGSFSFSEGSLLEETVSLLCYSRGTRRDTGLHPKECDLDMERFGNHVTQEE